MLAMIGKGAYSVPLAAHLLQLDAPNVHINPAAVRRWAYGYDRRKTHYAPAVEAVDFKEHDKISFLEMVELLHVAAFLQSGRSWPKVRAAIHAARRHLKQLNKSDAHPLAQHDWFAEGGSLYMQLAGEIDSNASSRAVMEAVGDGQVVLDECLRVYLRQIEFDPVTRKAQRWFPGAAIGGPIVCDPMRQMGLPITFAGGVRTDLIARHIGAGDSVQEIARSYRIREHAVEAAVQFEESLTDRAA